MLSELPVPEALRACPEGREVGIPQDALITVATPLGGIFAQPAEAA